MSQSTITEKRTIISSSSSGGYEALEDIPYKSNLGSRSNIISRSSLPHSTGGSQLVRTVEYGYGSSMGGMGPGGFSNVSNTGVNTVKNSREREKKDLRDLNERFANYIEKVRFLEAQNRKLGGELDELRSKWGKETSHIKQMYEAELTEARRLIDDLSKDKAALEIKSSSIVEQNSDIQRQLDEAKKYRNQDREQLNKLNQQLADYESEINMLRRSIESLETERSRDKGTINRLQQEVDKLRIDLNNETLAHLDAENRRQTLEEEMEFMKKVHEQELKELAALAYRDTTAENREFWKSELAQAIRDIQNEYDAKVDQLRGDMEAFYNLKIQEYRTGATKQNMEVTHVREENKKMVKQMADLRGKVTDLEARNAQLEKQYSDVMRELESKDTEHMMETQQLREEISKLRAEMEGILTELQTLMDAKLSLELEIAAYRKLLEGEENRIDWRSRATMIMYRDAIRPRSSFDRGSRDDVREKPVEQTEIREKPVEVKDKPEQKEVKEPVKEAKEKPVEQKEVKEQVKEVKEKPVTQIESNESVKEVKEKPAGQKEVVEKPIELKTQTLVSAEPELHDASPDTDAASNITMSSKGEVAETDIADLAEVGSELGDDDQKEESSDTNIQENDTDKAEPPNDHLVVVKEEVKRIENIAGDVTDGVDEQDHGATGETSTVVEDIRPGKVNNIESETVVETDEKKHPVFENVEAEHVEPSHSKPALDTKSQSPEKEIPLAPITDKTNETITIQIASKSDEKEPIEDNSKASDAKQDIPITEEPSVTTETKLSSGETAAESQLASTENKGKTSPSDDKPSKVIENTISLPQSKDQDQTKEAESAVGSTIAKDDQKDEIVPESGTTKPEPIEKKSHEPEQTLVKTQSEAEATFDSKPSDKDSTDGLEDVVKKDKTNMTSPSSDKEQVEVESLKTTDIDNDAKTISPADESGSKITYSEIHDKEDEKKQKQSHAETESAAPVKQVNTESKIKSDDVVAKDSGASSKEADTESKRTTPIDKAESEGGKSEISAGESTTGSETKVSDIMSNMDDKKISEAPASSDKTINEDVKDTKSMTKSDVIDKTEQKEVSGAKSKVQDALDSTEQKVSQQTVKAESSTETSQTETKPKDETKPDKPIHAEEKQPLEKTPEAEKVAHTDIESVLSKECETESVKPSEIDAKNNNKDSGKDTLPETVAEESKIEKTELPSTETKPEPSQPIKKPDSLIPETIGNTEDKVLETVVQSKIIEKSPQEQSLIIEASPSKELPEPFPDSEKIDEKLSDSKTEETTSKIMQAVESKSPDVIDDGKILAEEANDNSKELSTQDSEAKEIGTESGKIKLEDVEAKQEAVPLKQQTQAQDQPDQETAPVYTSTEDVQHVEQTKHVESEVQSLSKEVSSDEKDTMAVVDAKSPAKDEPIEHTKTVSIDKTEQSASVIESEKTDEKNVKQTAEQTQSVEQTKGTTDTEKTSITVTDCKDDVKEESKTESKSTGALSSEVSLTQTSSVEQAKTSGDIKSTEIVAKITTQEEENTKQVSKTETEQTSASSSDVIFKETHSVEQTKRSEEIKSTDAVTKSTTNDEEDSKQVSKSEIKSTVASSSDIAMKQTSALEQTKTEEDIKSTEVVVKSYEHDEKDSTQVSRTEIESVVSSSDIAVKQTSVVQQTKSETQIAETMEAMDTVTKDNKHTEVSTTLSASESKSPDHGDTVIVSKESNVMESSTGSTIEKSVSVTSQIVNGNAQDEVPTQNHESESITASDYKSPESVAVTEDVQKASLSTDKTEPMKETKEADPKPTEPKVNGEEEKAPKQVVQAQDGINEKIEKLLLNGEDTQGSPTRDKQDKQDKNDKKDSQVSMKMMRGEVSAKTTYQKTSTGPIAINEVAADGKYIVLENTSAGPKRQDVNLDNWVLRRTVDGMRDYTYKFRNFTLKPGKTVKILARGAASEAGLNDLVFRDEDTWGVGSQVKTSLVNDKSDEKASHVQKTLYN